MLELGIMAALAVVLLAVLLGSCELGYRAGRQSRSESIASQAATWEGALLGLLALLVGFTFAMAVTRFDGRRELILDEANAIEETMLRAGILDPRQRDEVTAVLHRYVDARVQFYRAGIRPAAIEAAQRETVALQEQLWSRVLSAARTRDSELMALFVGSAGQMVTAAAKRRATLDNHVPWAVMLMLVLVAGTAVAATGYSCGLHGRRHRLAMTLMPALIAMVVLMVFDLDNPRVGLIRSGQAPMLRLQQSGW
jgi:CDP-diglyceride synthetase